MAKKEESPAKWQGQTNNKHHKYTDNNILTQDIEVNILADTQLSNEVIFPFSEASTDLKVLAERIATTYQCPIEFVYVPMVNALSVLAGNRIRLFDGKYYNSPMHWMGIVAPSGSNKSQPFRFAFNPIKDIDRHYFSEWESSNSRWLQLENKNGTKQPTLKQYIVSEITQEGRNRVLNANKNGVCCYVDELAQKVKTLGRYTQNSGELQNELSVWDEQSFTISRKSSDPISIDNPFMAIAGTIQPSILRELFASGDFINSGYIQRWLWIFPESVAYPKYLDEPLCQSDVDLWRTIVETFEGNVRRLTQSQVITLTDQAKKLYISYFDALQHKKENANSDYERSIFSKLCIQCLRWALSLWIAQAATNSEEIPPQISESTMQYAIDCMRYFESTAMKVRTLITSNQDTDISNISREELIRLIGTNYPKALGNKQALADILGVSRAYVSRATSKKTSL